MADTPAPPKAKGKLPKSRWLLIGGAAAVGLLIFFYLRARGSGSNVGQATGTQDDGSTDAAQYGGTPAPQTANADGGTSSDPSDILANVLASQESLVAGSIGTLGGVIGSQDALIGELGVGALSLAQTSEQQLGTIAASAVGGLTSIATGYGSGAVRYATVDPALPSQVAPTNTIAPTAPVQSPGPAAGYSSNAPSSLTTARQNVGRGVILQ